jgi:hypothetical protein
MPAEHDPDAALMLRVKQGDGRTDSDEQATDPAEDIEQDAGTITSRGS